MGPAMTTRDFDTSGNTSDEVPGARDTSHGEGHGETRRRLVVVGNGMVSHRFCESWRHTTRTRITRSSSSARNRARRTIGCIHELLCLALRRRALARHARLVRRACHRPSNGRPSHAYRPRWANGDGRRRSILEYDLLVLATGSSPFVPPMPGSRKRGVRLSYDRRSRRDSRVCDESAAGGSHRRGLLGLEAARAVLDAGIPTHVVEVAPRLMPRQLDPAPRACSNARFGGLA